MKIKDLKRITGREIITVGPNDDISEALSKLIKFRIGALPVCDDKKRLVGIISERDILKGLYEHDNDVSKSKVRDLMSTEVIAGVPEDDIDDILKTMIEKGIRHLPVMVGSKLVGMLSLRDVIEERLTECTTQVRHLNEYISGGYK